MRLPRLFLLACLFVSVGLGHAADNSKTKQARDESTQILGSYKIASGEEAGAKIPAGKIEGGRVLIERNAITTTDKDGKHLYAATYRLDTGTSPWSITMTSTVPKQGEVAKGIIELKGNSLKLCYALPGAERPTEFKTKDRQLLFVLERVPERSPTR